MVDEQFPLQRKILKGQVNVRNEETSVCGRSENTDNRVRLGCFYSSCWLHGRWVCLFPDKVEEWDKLQGLNGQIKLRTTLFPLFSSYRIYWVVKNRINPTHVHESTFTQLSFMHRTYKNRKRIPPSPMGIYRTAPCSVSRGPAVLLEMQGEHQSRNVGWKTQAHKSSSSSSFSGFSTFLSLQGGMQPPLNCLWCCCSGSCASVEGRLLKVLVHCCITTS